MEVSGVLSVNGAVESGIGSSKNLSAGSILIDTVAAGPGINNSGVITVSGLTSVKNVTGTGVNAIQNKNTMTLGDVEIDGLYTTIGTNADGSQQTNVGNGIYNGKNLTLNGNASIRNIFTDQKNNTIGAGVCLSPGSRLTGSGSLTIAGAASVEEAYPCGIHNGVFLDAAAVDITGSINVSDVTNQGLYAANENAALNAGNINVSNAGGNGIYINRASGSMNVSGSVKINGAKGHGLSNLGTVTVGDIAIENISGKNGLESALADLPPISFAVVGEPTGMQPAVAEKGLMVLDCVSTGKAGHAARNEGINAITLAMKDIEWFNTYQFPEKSDFLGPVKMSVTIIHAGTQHNVIPDRCEFTVDIRTNEFYPNEKLFELIKIAGRLRNKRPAASASTPPVQICNIRSYAVPS